MYNIINCIGIPRHASTIQRLVRPAMPVGDPRITNIRALPLKGATPDGGWSQGFDEEGTAVPTAAPSPPQKLSQGVISELLRAPTLSLQRTSSKHTSPPHRTQSMAADRAACGLSTLIEIETDVGVGGLGSVFTSLLLVE